MNGYKCLWNGKSMEVVAKTSYEAQQIAVPHFQRSTRKRVKGHQITVVLCEKDGEQVTHAPTL